MTNRININKNPTNFFWFFCASFLFFTGFFLINSKTGFMSDDYLYHFIYCEYPDWGTAARISNFHDILMSMAAEYEFDSGRVPVHIVVQLLLMFDKAVFNICNSLIFILLGILVYFYANYGKKRSFFLFVLTFFLLWFFIPAARESMIWLSGSVNYMWACVFALLYLVPYRIYHERKIPFAHSMILAAAMVPMGFLAGWSHEIIGGVAGLIALIFTLFYYKNRVRVPSWAFSGIASTAVGLIILVAAPGNAKKSEAIINYENISYSFLKSFITVLNVSSSSLWPLFLILLVAFLVLFRIHRNSSENSPKKSAIARKKDNINFITPTVFYIFSAIMAIAFLSLAPVVYLRSVFVSAILLIISIVDIISKILNKIRLRCPANSLIAVLIVSGCLISICIDVAVEYHSCSYNYSVQTGIEESIESQVENGQKNIVFKGEYFFMSKGHFNIYNSGDPGTVLSLGTNPEFPGNKMFAEYFGAETLINEAKITLID